MIRQSTSDKKRQEENSSRRRKMITWFMAIIMVTSLFGYILMDRGNSGTRDLDYNGYKIESTKQGYLTHVADKKTLLTFDHPSYLESIKVEQPVWDELARSRVIGVTYNQSDDRADMFGAAQYLLEKNLLVAPKIYIQRGLYDANETQLQSMTCLNATPSMPIIEYGIGENSNITVQGDCIKVVGISGQEVLRMSDRLAFGLAGVMNKTQ